jgi:hypothetical protein
VDRFDHYFFHGVAMLALETIKAKARTITRKPSATNEAKEIALLICDLCEYIERLKWAAQEAPAEAKRGKLDSNRLP